MFNPVSFVHHINDLRTTCDHVKYVDDSGKMGEEKVAKRADAQKVEGK